MAGAPILFVTRKWPPAIGGMETYSLRLSEALGGLHETRVIALSGRGNGMPPSALALLLFPLVAAWRILTRHRRARALILADMAIWPLAVLVLLCGRPVIAIAAHGTDVSYHRRGGLKGRLYGAYLRLGARLLRGAAVIANSQATAEVLRETGWQAGAIVPLATDIDAPSPDGSHNGRLLFAGRLVERKGCRWFAENVLPLLPEDIELDIAGTGWSECEAGVTKLERVNWLGPLRGQQLVAAYREALTVIVPNIPLANGEYEGFGLVAPEAAAAGAMVLAADCDGLRDAVIDGTTGFLVEPMNARLWADRIRAIADMAPLDRLSKLRTAQSVARRHYAWERVARETLDAIFAAEGNRAELARHVHEERL